MNIVITGSTKGLGLALAISFLEFGDKVVISSRSQDTLSSVLQRLQLNFPKDNVYGIVCDVTKPSDVSNLVESSVKYLGSIDFWINNAGTGVHVPLVENSDEMLTQIVSTNLLGTLFGCREVLKLYLKQNHGHIVNIAGRGSNGDGAANMVAYTSTKRSLDVLNNSLRKEITSDSICLHLISPGMVMTDLLVQNSLSLRTKKVFNILAEHPTTVAKKLVPKIRKFNKTGQNCDLLTRPKAVLRFLLAFRYKNKFFDDQGNLVVSVNPLDVLPVK